VIWIILADILCDIHFILADYVARKIHGLSKDIQPIHILELNGIISTKWAKSLNYDV
jgi:hypothetical protein